MSDTVRQQLVLDASQHSANWPPPSGGSSSHFSQGCLPNLQLPGASVLMFCCPPNTLTGIFQRRLPASLHSVLLLPSGSPVSPWREAGVHPRPRPFTRPSPHIQSPRHLSPLGLVQHLPFPCSPPSLSIPHMDACLLPPGCPHQAQAPSG